MKKNIQRINKILKLFYHNSESKKIIKNWIQQIKKALEINKKFYNHPIKKCNIIFVNSKKEMNKYWGQKTPDYIMSITNRSAIVIYSPSVIEKQTTWKKSDFYPAMIHEISHLYFKEITKKYTPLWLNEGLATYLENNEKKARKYWISYAQIKKRYNKNKPINYKSYYYFVSFLIEKYGKDKTLEMLSQIKKNKNIEKIFKIVFKKSLKDVIKDANNN